MFVVRGFLLFVVCCIGVSCFCFGDCCCWLRVVCCNWLVSWCCLLLALLIVVWRLFTGVTCCFAVCGELLLRFVDWWLLLVVSYCLFIYDCSLCVVCCSLLVVVRCWLLLVRCLFVFLLFVVGRLWCWWFVCFCLLLAVC